MLFPLGHISFQSYSVCFGFSRVDVIVSCKPLGLRFPTLRPVIAVDLWSLPFCLAEGASPSEGLALQCFSEFFPPWLSPCRWKGLVRFLLRPELPAEYHPMKLGSLHSTGPSLSCGSGKFSVTSRGLACASASSLTADAQTPLLNELGVRI